jgi:hypothetical protein
MLVALPLLLFGPGYLIERGLRLFPHPALALRPAFWLGLSLSAVALLYEWATALGLALAPPALDALALSCALGVLWQSWANERPKTKDQTPMLDETTPVRSSFLGPWSFVLRPWSLALLAILALTLWVRFYEIRDLALPAWVDSVHHALMIRVAAESGQAPLSLRPYLPVDQIPYHWGYHVFVAALLRLSGAPLPQTMLWSGQVLSALHVLAVSALAGYLWRRHIAGLVGGGIVGLLSIWPAYYTSWGRYTQLGGLLLLPPLMIAWLEMLRIPRRRLALALALLLAGMSLIHFIVLLMALCFMAVSGITWALGNHSGNSSQFAAGGRQPAGDRSTFDILAGTLWQRGRQSLLPGGLGLALAGPWLWALLSRALAPQVGRSQPLAGTSASYYALDQALLWAGVNRWLIALALLAALVAIRRRWSAAGAQLVWVGALFVLANPWLALYLAPAAGAGLLISGAERRQLASIAGGAALLALNPWLVRLPYLAIFSNEVVVISLFIPIAVLIGGGVALLWGNGATGRNDQRLGTKDQQPVTGMYANFWSLVLGPWSFGREVIVLAMVALALWGAWNLRDVVNQTTVFATQADVAAIEWAAKHTPPDARFLINATAWLGTGRGADGGWWLLPLAGRWTSTPPVLYDFGPPDYVEQTRANIELVRRFQPGQEQQIYNMIDRERITFVYLGAGSKPLRPDVFPPTQGFEKIYEHDGVTIFAVHR